jgi:hypothetical protein
VRLRRHLGQCGNQGKSGPMVILAGLYGGGQTLSASGWVLSGHQAGGRSPVCRVTTRNSVEGRVEVPLNPTVDRLIVSTSQPHRLGCIDDRQCVLGRSPDHASYAEQCRTKSQILSLQLSPWSFTSSSLPPYTIYARSTASYTKRVRRYDIGGLSPVLLPALQTGIPTSSGIEIAV